MSNNINLNESIKEVENIFKGVNVTEFLIRLRKKENFWEMLTQENREDLNKVIDKLVQNARVEETRKQQQEFFFPTLKLLKSPNIKEEYNTNTEFKYSLLTLSIIFLAGFHDLHHKDQEHHEFIAVGINEAIKKITE